MIVVPFINTVCSIKYKRYILNDFNMDMLGNVKMDGEKLFDNWHGRNMGAWDAFTNVNTTASLEFYDDHYVIKPQKLSVDTYKLPLPKTLSDFINDCYRCGVELNWSKNVINGFDDFELLKDDEIEEHYNKLLKKIGKDEVINLE